jgi:multisubunit Na+/H+ antiporter MnhE subunit
LSPRGPSLLAAAVDTRVALTSAQPGDALVGLVLGTVLAVALRPRRPATLRLAGLVALAPVLVRTAVEMARGSWRTARFCLGAPAQPGLVEIPRGDRSPARVALWGVLTGEAPDEYPVDVDGERRVLIVHLLNASDPGAVRARHAQADERWQRRVVS